MSLQVSYTKQLIFGLILLVILLLVIEIIAIIILDRNDSCYVGLPLSGLYPQYSDNFLKSLCNDYKSIIDYDTPYKHLEPNQKTETVNINSYGFRGIEFNQEKDLNTYRIILLGGSTMYGLHATSESTTIPGYLQNRFDTETLDVNVEVINAGINGASSFDEINSLNDKLLKLDPDMIVVYDGGNDLVNSIKNENELKSWPNETEHFFKKFRNYYKTTQFFEYLDRIFQKKIMNDQGISKSEITEDVIPKKVEIWKNRWTKACKQNEINGIDTVITIQPYLGVGNKVLTEWENMIKKQYNQIDVSGAFPLLINELMEMEEICTKTIDLTNVFDNENETIFYDLIHVGDAGNEIVAEEMFKNILSIIIEKNS
jgi:hypothetical protein